jgi:hypothetical protein
VASHQFLLHTLKSPQRRMRIQSEMVIKKVIDRKKSKVGWTEALTSVRDPARFTQHVASHRSRRRSNGC